MPITASDLLWKLTIKTGTAGDQSAQPDPNASLGKYASTTQITDATLHNLFDVVTGDENAASDVEYRAVIFHNAHATLTLQSPVAWIASEIAGGASAAISVDTTAASAVNASAAQMKEVADESTAPSGQTFTAPTTKAAGLPVGDLAAGQVRGIWVRRTAANTAALDLDGVTLRVEGDTAA
jgi:hypothetical protein